MVGQTIYYTMTHKILALIQQPAQSVIASLKLKNTSLTNFISCKCQLGNKDSRYSLKQNIFNFPKILWYNFIKDEKFEEEILSHKNTAKFKDFTMPKFTSSGFFYKSDFALKEQSTVIYSRILCNIM